MFILSRKLSAKSPPLRATSECNEDMGTGLPMTQNLPATIEYPSVDNTATATDPGVRRANHLVNVYTDGFDSLCLRFLLSISAFTVSLVLVYGIHCSGTAASPTGLQEEFGDASLPGKPTVVYHTVSKYTSTTYTGAPLDALSRLVQNLETCNDQIETSNTLLDELSAADTPQRAEAVRELVRQSWLFHEIESIQLLLREGSDAMSRGEYQAAETRFLDAIRRDPLYAEAWNKLATVHYITHQYEASVRESERTLSLEPRHLGAMLNKARIFFELRQYGDAAEQFRDIHEIIPALESFQSDIVRAEALQSKNVLLGDTSWWALQSKDVLVADLV